MHSNAALGRKPHIVTGVLVVFTCLNSKWRIALSSVAWERSMSLGLTSTFQNPPEELKNACSSGQKQSYFSKFQKRWHFGKACFSTVWYCSLLLQCTWTRLELICFAFIWIYRYLMCVFFLWSNKVMRSRSVCENSQLPHCFLFMYCLIVINAGSALFPWKHLNINGEQSTHRPNIACETVFKIRRVGSDDRGGCVKYYNKLVIHFLFKDWCPLCPCCPTESSLLVLTYSTFAVSTRSICFITAEWASRC